MKPIIFFVKLWEVELDPGHLKCEKAYLFRPRTGLGVALQEPAALQAWLPLPLTVANLLCAALSDLLPRGRSATVLGPTLTSLPTVLGPPLILLLPAWPLPSGEECGSRQ